MKVKKIVVSTIELELDISGATLLTREEAREIPKRLRECGADWWLKSPGHDSSRVAIVDDAGYVLDYGYCVSYDHCIVRPVLIISNFESSRFKVGDTFEFGDKEFKIISTDKALCLSDIGGCAFRYNWKASDADDYEKSDVKKYIDKWFEKVKETKE